MVSDGKNIFLYDKIQKIGFKLPREHGLTAIGVVAVLLGIAFSLTGEIDIIGLLMTLIFSVVVILGSDSTMSTIKRKFSSIKLFPAVIIEIITFLILSWKPIWQVFFIFFILAIMTSAWMISAFKSRKLSPLKLVFGAVALSMLVSLISVVSSTVIKTTYFVQVLAFNWIFIGVNVFLILYVESLRDKVNPYLPLVTWIIFLFSFLLLIMFRVLPIISIIAIIEPTILGIYQGLKKEVLKKSKKPIKTVVFNF
ncbi:MAG: hypothetical protein ACFE9L_05995 [Candidatus Hodarchaeota archaeon]